MTSGNISLATVNPTITAIVLSFNRREALARTLANISALPGVTSIVVVDNASTDGSAHMVRDQFPQFELVQPASNVGVAGFNRGVERATSDLVLILDDDAYPDSAALQSATALLAREPRIGAVAFSPVHPATHAHEWPHAAVATRAFPMMGCGNLVRTALWRQLGGYEESFFLYRNDTELALKVLAAGFDVVFDPSWVVWHDSPAAARKSERWLHLATRNWIWMSRRHGRGWWGWLGRWLGVAKALLHAGARRARLAAVLRGVREGQRETPPLAAGVQPDGSAWRQLVMTQLRRSPRSTRTVDPAIRL